MKKSLKLIKQIEEAFKGVQLEDGISLNMTEFYDSYEQETKFLELAKNDERRSWESIDDETLEEFTGTFAFTDLKGFRFYLPAYMIYTLKNYKTSDSIITDFTIYALQHDHYIFKKTSMRDFFTKEQFECILKFLEFSVEEDDHLDGNLAKTNLIGLKQT